nr:TNF receptor-associated factor 4-like [Pocillopora verrucosa]
MEEEFFSAEEPELGGHDFVFVDELSLGQICPICLVAMCNPVQTVCGHRFCESCLLGTFREGVGRVCPQDRTSIPEDGGYFRDVAWERDILSLRVKCKKSARGCDWTGMLRYYEDHVQLCEYEDVFCDDCNEELQRRSLNKHQTTECHNRIVQCEHCAVEFAFRLTESHEDECLRWPLDSGCNFYDKRSNLNAHIAASCEEHLRKTWSKLLQTTERVNELEQVELHMQADIDSVKKSLEEAKKDVVQLKLSEAQRKLENLQLKKDVLELQKKLKELHPVIKRREVSDSDTEKDLTNEETTKSKGQFYAKPDYLSSLPFRDLSYSKQWRGKKELGKVPSPH